MSPSRRSGRLFLPLVILALASGASGGPVRAAAQTAPTAPAAPGAWRQERFLIGAWEGPQIHRGLAITRHTMGRARQAGIDVIFKSRGTIPEVNRHVDEALRVARELGMQIVVSDEAITDQKGFRPCTDAPENDTRPCAERFACATNRFRNHPDRDQIFGYYIQDEPDFDDFEDVKCRIAAVRRNDPARAPVVNLYPSAWRPVRESEERYRAYLDSFVNGDAGRDLPFLSFDHYYYLKGYYGDGPPSYFRNLRTAREVAGAKPLWVIVAASGFDGYPAPSLPQLRVMACAAIAYGAKGIAYFKYSGEQGLIVDASDSAAVTFEPIARMNRYFKAIAGPVLFADSLVGTFHQSTEPTSEVVPGREQLDPVRTPLVARSVNPAALVSVFQNRAARSVHHLWVMNKGTSRIPTDFELRGDFRGRIRAPVPMTTFVGDTTYVAVPVRYSSATGRTTVPVTLDGGAAGMFRVLGATN